MENLLQERIEIINGYKGHFINSKRIPEQKQISLLKTNFVFYVIISFLLILLLIITTFAIVFKLNYSWMNWNEAGLISLLAMSTALQIPIIIQDKFIAKRKKQIKIPNLEIDKESNKELEAIIKQFNKRRKHFYLYGFPAIIVAIAAVFQVFNDQEYWSYFPVIVLIVCVYLIIYNLSLFLRIRKY